MYRQSWCLPFAAFGITLSSQAWDCITRRKSSTLLSCRAAERRDDIIACIQQRGYKQLFDMSSSEGSQKYLEGTGALVPDRVNGLVYVNLSERADEKLAQQWADHLGYKDVVTFRSVNHISAVN